MLTLESDSGFEGDSISKGKSESEDATDYQGESGSEDDFDSEGDSDSEGNSDSNGGPDSKGDLASEVDLTSEVDPTSKGGHAFEGEAYEGGPDSEGELPQLQRPHRVRQIPRRLADFKLLRDIEIDLEREVIQNSMMVDIGPVSINEALKNKVWVNAMKEELQAIERSKTWELTILPQNKKAVSMRWVFKIKLKLYGSIPKYKTRLVARGFLQKSGLEYFKVFTIVTRHETIRLVIAIDANRNWPLIHLNIILAFLNGPLQ